MNPPGYDWRTEGTSEWYESLREDFYPNYGEGYIAYGPSARNNYGFDNNPPAYSRELDASYGDNMQGMGGFFQDLGNMLEGELKKTTNTLVTQSGETIRNLITGEPVQAPPGQVAVGFDPQGAPIFMPQPSFMDKYGAVVYGGMAAAGVLLLALILRRPEPRYYEPPGQRRKNPGKKSEAQDEYGEKLIVLREMLLAVNRGDLDDPDVKRIDEMQKRLRRRKNPALERATVEIDGENYDVVVHPDDLFILSKVA